MVRSTVIQIVFPALRVGGDTATVVETDLLEYSDRGGVPFPDGGPESTPSGCCCFRNDDPRGFGCVAVAVDAPREFIGDLRFLIAGLADDESAVPDEVGTDAPLDGVEGQRRRRMYGLLLPQVFNGRSPIGVDLATRPGIPLSPEIPMSLRVRPTPRAQVEPSREQLGGHRLERRHEVNATEPLLTGERVAGTRPSALSNAAVLHDARRHALTARSSVPRVVELPARVPAPAVGLSPSPWRVSHNAGFEALVTGPVARPKGAVRRRSRGRGRRSNGTVGAGR